MGINFNNEWAEIIVKNWTDDGHYYETYLSEDIELVETPDETKYEQGQDFKNNRKCWLYIGKYTQEILKQCIEIDENTERVQVVNNLTNDIWFEI